MEVKINIENGNIARVYTMQDELFCSFELPPEIGTLNHEWMVRRIDNYFYENKKAIDRLEIISSVVRKCTQSGFVPRLCFDDELSRQDIGSVIRQVRLQRGLKAKDIAMLVGIAPANYSHIENGQTSPTYKTLLRIAEVLDIRLDIQPIETGSVNDEERAVATQNKEWEDVQKRLVAQVRNEHPSMWWWAAKRVKETKYYKQLLKDINKG